MNSPETVVLPAHPPRSDVARILGWLAVLMFGAVVLADWALTSSGMPPAERPTLLRALLVLAVLGPGLLWLFAPLVGRLPGLGWLVDNRPLALTFDRAGFTLRQGADDRTVAWPDVRRLVVSETWPPSGEVVLRDDTKLKLPGELVLGRLADGRRTTLLEEVDRLQPSVAQLEARRRAAATVRVIVLGALAVLGLIGFALLYLR